MVTSGYSHICALRSKEDPSEDAEGGRGATTSRLTMSIRPVTHERAETAEQQAEQLRARLRELGVDPDG
jgi:hypothetical protein